MSGVISSAFRTAYTLAFQVSPIIFQGGIAANAPGGMLPIIALTGQAAALAQGFISGLVNSGGLTVNDFYAQYLPLAGGTIINNSVATYPFANQQVAANAIIEEPTSISLRMIAPVNQTGGYVTKLPILTALRTSFKNHNAAGGTYAIATPAFIYDQCLMTGMTDITDGDGNQQQIEWQLDFYAPLITLNQAKAAKNALMSKLSGGQQITGTPTWSGTSTAIGQAVQGGAQGVTGLPGALNQFFSTAIPGA